MGRARRGFVGERRPAACFARTPFSLSLSQSAKDAKGTIRLSIGRFTKKQDFRKLAAALGRAAG